MNFPMSHTKKIYIADEVLLSQSMAVLCRQLSGRTLFIQHARFDMTDLKSFG